MLKRIIVIAGLALLAACQQGQQNDVPTYDQTVAPVVMPQAVYGTSAKSETAPGADQPSATQPADAKH